MRSLSLVLGLSLLGFGQLAAQRQWGLALEYGAAGFHGHASSTTLDPEASAHPSATRTWGFRLDRTGPKIGLSVGILVASTGVEIESDESAAEARDIVDLLELSPQVSILVFKPHETAVRVHLGLVIDRWSPDGDDTRTKMGGLGALGLHVPFSSRLEVQVRLEATVTGSVFDEDDLPPEFERKSGWSERAVFGVRFGI